MEKLNLSKEKISSNKMKKVLPYYAKSKNNIIKK